jgi:hypothetical protein
VTHRVTSKRQPLPPAWGRTTTSAGRYPAPSAVEIVLYAGLLVLAAVGVVSPGTWNLLPAESLLEGVFILATALCLSRMDASARGFLIVALAFLALKVALMAFGGGDQWIDFIQAHKAYFYLLGLAFYVRRRLFYGPRLANVVTLLLIACLVKYGYSQLLGLDSRPGIYGENNYELIMIIGLFHLGSPYMGSRRPVLFVALTAVVLLSGSRSAALALVLLYAVSYLRLRNRLWPLHVLGLGVVGVAVFALFAARDPGGVQTIDRYQFLQTFLYEVRSWPLWEFLTGSYPLTALSPESCSDLSFYASLFSHSTPGVCYSVILHSYLLRAVFDHGLLGLALLYVLLWMVLRRSGASRRDAVLLLGILTISGLSVSAFNNVFAAVTLAVALGLNRDRAREHPSPLRPPRPTPASP